MIWNREGSWKPQRNEAKSKYVHVLQHAVCNTTYEQPPLLRESRASVVRLHCTVAEYLGPECSGGPYRIVDTRLGPPPPQRVEPSGLPTLSANQTSRVPCLGVGIWTISLVQCTRTCKYCGWRWSREIMVKSHAVGRSAVSLGLVRVIEEVPGCCCW